MTGVGRGLRVTDRRTSLCGADVVPYAPSLYNVRYQHRRIAGMVASGEKLLYGGIEAGGTKFVCAVGTSPDDLRAEARFPTTTPAETLGRVIGFFREQAGQGRLAAVGVSCFGPVDLDAGSPTYGYITSTPKRGWEGTDVVGAMRRALGLPVGFDTDTNGAALAEHRWGAARGLDSFIYLTVGTGIGGGGLVNGRLLHGLTHPEMGHIRVPRVPGDESFAGVCPFHCDCLEGLASGPAIEARWRARAENLPPDHPAWEMEARYLGLALNDLVCALSPLRIVMGGGVMGNRRLFPMVREHLRGLLNDYVRAREITELRADYIVPPELGERAGVLGGIALAQDAVASA